jgi:hypothetical protein
MSKDTTVYNCSLLELPSNYIDPSKNDVNPLMEVGVIFGTIINQAIYLNEGCEMLVHIAIGLAS